MIEPKRRKDTGGWRVELPAKHSPTGKRRVRSFAADQYAQAKQWADELSEAIRLREAGVHSQTTVAQAVTQFLDGPYGKALADSTLATYRSADRKHVQAWGLSQRIAALDEETVLEWMNELLEAGVGVEHVKTIIRLVSRATRLACRRDKIPMPEMGAIGELLAAASRARSKEVQEIQCWTPEEAATLLECSQNEPHWFQTFLRAAADTGMRRGELMGLQIGDLNFARGEIRVRRAIVGNQITTPKSGKAHTAVMPPGLAEMLRVHLEPRRFEDAEPEAWVFARHRGDHLRIYDVSRCWKRTRKRAAARGVRPLKFHVWRHTWASSALAARQPITWVSARLGHANPNITLRVYSHLVPDQTEDLSWLERGHETTLNGSKRRKACNEEATETE